LSSTVSPQAPQLGDPGLGAGVILVVARHEEHTQARAQIGDRRRVFAQGRHAAIDQIARDRHDVRVERVDLGHHSGDARAFDGRPHVDVADLHDAQADEARIQAGHADLDIDDGRRAAGEVETQARGHQPRGQKRRAGDRHQLRAHGRVRRQRADEPEHEQEQVAQHRAEEHERHEAHQRQAHPGHVIGQRRFQQEPPEERRRNRQRRQHEPGPGGHGGWALEAEPADDLHAHVGMHGGDDRQSHGEEHEEGGGRFLHGETMPEIPGGRTHGRTGHRVSASRRRPSCV
jgi:hypothetical protein